MGWFSRVLYKETDILSTIYDLKGWLKAINFNVEDMEEKFSDDDSRLFQRIKASRGNLKLTILWDGDVATFLQNRELTSDPEFEKYQRFHAQKRYFVITYGGPGHTVIVKHSVFMSRDTPVIAASVARVMEAWDLLDFPF